MSSNSQYCFVIFVFFIGFLLSSCSLSEPPSHDQVSQQNQDFAHESKIETILVSSNYLKKKIYMTAELSAFREVPIYPKVQGFVKDIFVDRGSPVHRGQVLVNIIAPELEANYRESQAKYEGAKSALLQVKSKIEGLIAQKDEAEAKLEADEANHKRVQHAAKTVGAIAEIDLESAEKTVQASKARLRSAQQMIQTARQELESEKARVLAAEQALVSVGQIKSYLTVRAPFNGIVSERNVHEGSLVSSSPSNPPMLKIEETSKLRLLVPVPEAAIAGIKQGETMTFVVPAFVGKVFSGVVTRISHTLERKSRTMMVELDVLNSKKELQPGMYAEVVWDMSRPYKTLFVPSSAILSNNDRTYILRVRKNKVERILVDRGQLMGTLVEIVGAVKEGDELVLHASEEIKPDSMVETRLLTPDQLQKTLEANQED